MQLFVRKKKTIEQYKEFKNTTKIEQRVKSRFLYIEKVEPCPHVQPRSNMDPCREGASL